MTDKLGTEKRFDLDAAFAALEGDERVARPVPTQRLVARVLADAAEVAAGFGAETAAPRARPAAAPQRANGWLHWFGFSDAWAGATVAAVVLCLAVGVGVGYQAGPEMLAEVGLGEIDVLLADADDGDFGAEDVL